jgi:hypothetical protein
VPGGRPGEAHELTRELELPVFSAETFQLEAKDLSRLSGDLRAGVTTPPGRGPLPDCPADDGKRLPRRIAQDTSEGASGVGSDELAETAPYRAEYVAEEVLELLFVQDFKQLGSELDFQRLVERGRNLSGLERHLITLAERFRFGSPRLELSPIDVMHPRLPPRRLAVMQEHAVASTRRAPPLVPGTVTTERGERDTARARPAPGFSPVSAGGAGRRGEEKFAGSRLKVRRDEVSFGERGRE